MSRAMISRGPLPGSAPVPHVDMSTKVGPLELPTPVMTASGCAAAGRELDQFFDVAGIGAVVTKTIMLQPRSGRATPRMAETPSGMLNSIGLQGPGIDAFVERDLAWLEERRARAIVSIAGDTVEDFGKIAARLRNNRAVTALEVNISCPNVADRGQVFACRAGSAADVINAVRRHSDPRLPIFAKLSPDVTDIVEIADSVVRAGATGVTVMNTTLGMVIDIDTMRPQLAGVTGGLSGPAIRPMAVRAVWQIRQAFPDLPIIGVGGIRSGRDALEFVLAGANAVQVGTVIFHDPSAPMRVQQELHAALGERGFPSLEAAVSYAHRPPDPEPIPEPEVTDDFDYISE